MQHGRSVAHQQIQLHLKTLIPELLLERRVEGRIADALWEEKKIVFEIQCSSLSLHEAKQRCEDYAKCGYTPVWLLHDRRFNRKSLSSAEEYLRTYATAFFTDGRHIYDQFDVCASSRRLYQGPKLFVDPALPRKSLTLPLLSRSWPLSFQGDLYHWAETHDIAFLQKIAARYRRQRRGRYLYKFLLYRLLEMCC